MLIKYYSLKTYREVLRKKGASAGIDFLRGNTGVHHRGVSLAVF